MGARSIHSLGSTLALAIKQGAALAAIGTVAGCAGKSQHSIADDGPATGGSTALGGTGSSGAGGSDTRGGSGGASELSPYRLEDLGCYGPVHDGGYMGQCCVSARCYTPDAGACLLPEQAPPIPLPPGSGTCGCEASESVAHTVSGPFAPNPEGMASPNGSCCYLVGSIGCEGRPLLVEGVAVVAPLVRRNDWRASRT
jgi:hypothetical protein